MNSLFQKIKATPDVRIITTTRLGHSAFVAEAFAMFLLEAVYDLVIIISL